MSTAQSPVPADHPLMLAWSRYRASRQFDTALRWLSHEEHREGQMWAAFMAGWDAHGSVTPVVLDGSALARRQLALLLSQAQQGHMMRVIPPTLPPSPWWALSLMVLLVSLTVLVTLWCVR